MKDQKMDVLEYLISRSPFADVSVLKKSLSKYKVHFSFGPTLYLLGSICKPTKYGPNLVSDWYYVTCKHCLKEKGESNGK